MLTHLAIRNIVLIEALDLEFSGGLGVLTGETGAGKSILLDALGLILGNRADSGLVRAGEDQASVSASFDFALPLEPIREILSEADIEFEAGEPLILRRRLKSDGGSKAFVNDQPVGVALLRSLAPYLVELHGQHDDRGLVNPKGHRDLLDNFVGIDRDELAGGWQRWQSAAQHLDSAKQSVQTAKEDQDLLLAHLSELTALEPQAGEEERLASRRSDMQKGERLSEELAEMRMMWEGSDAPLAALRSAARKLDRIAGEHALLGEALASLDRAVIEAGEAEEKLTAAALALIHDPEALDQAETRLFDLRALARKHRCEVDELPSLMRRMGEELAAIEGGEAELDTLELAASEARKRFEENANVVFRRRLESAKRLDKAVEDQLKPLKLDAARFLTKIEKLPSERWGPYGMDSVEFEIATNPGADFAPLGKIASGGELSRFILALKVALAEQGGAATVIFDEIDRGVGGAVASAIGDRLARLAGKEGKGGGQLLAVTHSPQVASRGDQHYQIAKSSQGTVTRTSVALLDDHARLEEIARMLSGAEITPEARAQAARLVEGV